MFARSGQIRSVERAEVQRQLERRPAPSPSASVSTMRNSVRPFGASGAASHRAERPAAARRRRREMEEAADVPVARPRRRAKTVPGDVEIVDRHREAALGLVAAPLLRDLVERRAQRLVGVLGGDDAQAVAGLRHARHRLPHLADRPAFERERRRMQHRLLADRDRAHAELPVAVEVRLRRADHREPPAVRARDAAELGEQRIELVLVADRVAADRAPCPRRRGTRGTSAASARRSSSCRAAARRTTGCRARTRRRARARPAARRRSARRRARADAARGTARRSRAGARAR